MELRKEDVTDTEAVAKEKHPYALNNVRVEPGKLVACDGRILFTREVVMEQDEETFEPYLLDGKALKASVGKDAFLRQGENGSVKIRAVEQRNGTLIPNGIETTLAKGDGSYPTYERVIPSNTWEGLKTALLDPALIILLMKAFKGVESVRICILSEDEAIRFAGETPDGRKVVGVMMPLVNS